jgi:DNA-binding LacI/PurR family transcriptional regulator
VKKAQSPRKRATIRDVAALAGVSKSLVSLVYSDPSAVSEEKTKRVLKAASDLSFNRNFLARSLAGSSGIFVGILVADLHNPLFAEVVDLVRLQLEQSGQYGFMTSAMLPGINGTQRLDTRTVRALIDLRPRSVLVVGSVSDMSALDEIPSEVQIVVASAIPEKLKRAITVRSDDVLGMKLIIDHLVERGHKKIAHFGGAGGRVASGRLLAYKSAMRAHGLEKFIDIESADFTEKSGYQAAIRLLGRSAMPTAITAVNDLAAIGVQAAMSEMGIKIGEGIAVTGYDNTYLAQIKQISLTSVDPGNGEIAVQAAKWLVLDPTEKIKPGSEYLAQPKLLVRESSAGLC